MKQNVLSLVTLFVLNSKSSDIYIATPGFLWLLSALHILILPLLCYPSCIFKLSMCLIQTVKNRIKKCFFLIQPENLCFDGMIIPFTFNVITVIVGLYVCHLIFVFKCLGVFPLFFLHYFLLHLSEYFLSERFNSFNNFFTM